MITSIKINNDFRLLSIVVIGGWYWNCGRPGHIAATPKIDWEPKVTFFQIWCLARLYHSCKSISLSIRILWYHHLNHESRIILIQWLLLIVDGTLAKGVLVLNISLPNGCVLHPQQGSKKPFPISDPMAFGNHIGQRYNSTVRLYVSWQGQATSIAWITWK